MIERKDWFYLLVALLLAWGYSQTLPLAYG